MNELRKVLRLSKKDFFETHLSLINCLLPKKMTPMEIKVVAGFMALDGDIALFRFGPSARKIIMKELGLSPAGLSNYIGSLTAKGFLTVTVDVINILPLLIPQQDEQLYLFKLVNMEQNGTVTTIKKEEGSRI